MLGALGIFGWWLCCLGWMATLDWVGRDSVRYRLAPQIWVPVCTLAFLIPALVAWWIPSGLAVAAIVPLAWLVPALVYVLTRNARLPAGKQVLTPNHFRNIASRLGKRVGLKIEQGLQDDEPPLPEVDFLPAESAGNAGGDEKRKQLAAMPGQRVAREIVVGAVLARAARAAIEPVADGVLVRYEVDTVWQNRRRRVPPAKRGERDRYPVAPAFPQAEGVAAMNLLRAAAGLAADGRGPQGGEFVLSVDGKKQTCRVGGRSGARLELDFPVTPPKFKTLGDLGVADSLREQIQRTLKLEKGLFLVSGPAGAGLTTTIDMVLQSADRLMRDFVSIEDQAAPAKEVQNVKVQRFDGRSVQATDAVTAAMREYPQGLVTRDIRDKPLLLELARLAGENQFVILSLKANDALDAIARVMQAGVPADLLARTLVGSLSVRLVRRLCPRCREHGPPAAEILRRFKRRPEQVPQIHRAAPDGCSLCQGAGYVGRIGIFELAAGSRVRQGVEAKAKPAVLRELAVKDGMVPFDAAGFEAAIAGTTSVDEVDRVLAPAPGPAPGKG